MSNWEFHFRNFDPAEQWFGVYHAGCGGAPWHTGRPRCWDCTIPTNILGGDNSVYVPSSWVVDFGQWISIIMDGLDAIVELGLVIGTGGADMPSLVALCADAFNIDQAVVQTEIANQGITAADLSQAISQNFANACAPIAGG
jgi:hypothetical protein